MMTPKDYPELVELIAEFGSGCDRGSMWAKTNEVKKDAWRAAMERALNAMQAVGVAQVPVEATEAMREAFIRSSGQLPNDPNIIDLKVRINAAIAAAPYASQRTRDGSQ